MKNSNSKIQLAGTGRGLLGTALLFAAFFAGCEKLPTDVVDTKTGSYQFTITDAPVNYSYNKTDSLYKFTLSVTNRENVNNLVFEVYFPDGSLCSSGQYPVALKPAKANSVVPGIISGTFPMSKSYPNGKYRIQFYAEETDGTRTRIAVHEFIYSNSSVNYPPVISNLNMPDTVEANVPFTITLKVSDPNGLSDVKKVLFRFTRQDGSISDPYELYDNGNLNYGDQTAGDGIYSLTNYFTQDASGQTRTFTFQAKDSADSLSNIITHKIYIK